MSDLARNLLIACAVNLIFNYHAEAFGIQFLPIANFNILINVIFNAISGNMPYLFQRIINTFYY